MVYAILTEDGLDQVCETAAQSKREAKELRAMGCTVKVKEFNSEEELYDWVEKRGL